MPTKLPANMNTPSFATVAACNVAKTELTVTEVELDWNKVEKAKTWVGKDVGVARINKPVKQIEDKGKNRSV